MFKKEGLSKLSSALLEVMGWDVAMKWKMKISFSPEC
jgi:hypothetical protein